MPNGGTENGQIVFTVDLSDFINTTPAGATVKVEYSAVVENDHTYNNNATVNADTVHYEGGTVTGYEGNVSLKKVNTKGTVLNGAEFQLLKGTTPVSVVKVSDGVYKVGIIELVYIVLQSVVKPGITGFFKIDLHIKCYIYLS